MQIAVLQQAVWKQKKKTAELWHRDKVILSMEFGSKKSKVFFDDRKWEIVQAGFWSPEVTISEEDQVLLRQKHIGFWGHRNEVVIGDGLYEAKTHTGVLYNVRYTNASGTEVVSYRLTALKRKATVVCIINAASASAADILLLFVLGYYTVRAVVQETNAGNEIVVAENYEIK